MICFVIWKFKGDLEHFTFEYFLPSFNAVAFCAACPAVTTVASATCGSNFNEDAAWLAGVYTAAQFTEGGFCTHPIFQLAGVSILTLAFDLMHCKHLGVDQYLFGSVLVLLCFYVMRGSPEDNLSYVFGIILRYCKEHNIKTYNAMTLKMFCDPTDVNSRMPMLKGRAAEVKSLGLGALLHVWCELMTNGNVQHEQIKMCLLYVRDVERILTDHVDKIKYPASVYDEFKRIGFNFCLMYNDLANHYAHEEGMKIFNITVKLHFLRTVFSKRSGSTRVWVGATLGKTLCTKRAHSCKIAFEGTRRGAHS